MKDQQNHYEQKLKYEIDSWDLFDRIQKVEKIKIIDTRSAAAYELEHIPDSFNLPHREMSEVTTGDWNKDFLYVTYCDGVGCNASTKGAFNMTKLGFNVKELIGGIDWWKRDNYETHGSNGSSGEKVVCGC